MLWSREPWEHVDDVGIDSMPPGRFVPGVTLGRESCTWPEPPPAAPRDGPAPPQWPDAREGPQPASAHRPEANSPCPARGPLPRADLGDSLGVLSRSCESIPTAGRHPQRGSSNPRPCHGGSRDSPSPLRPLPGGPSGSPDFSSRHPPALHHRRGRARAFSGVLMRAPGRRRPRRGSRGDRSVAGGPARWPPPPVRGGRRS